MKRIKTRILLCALLCLTLISSSALPLFAQYQAPPASPSQNVSNSDSKNVNGKYVISVLKDGQWQEAGRLGFDMFLKEKTLDLSSILPESSYATVRIVQEGGEAAHLDSVFLGGEAPQSVNFDDGILLLKLSKKDLDLINVDPEGIELVFPENRSNDILSVTGRIEGERIGQEPFKFPSENTFIPMSENSKFYTYKMNTNFKELTVDGRLDEIDGMKPLFKEYCTPGTGHPEGYTYGWVMNDDDYLYAVVDFTPDNTMDGDKDYSELFIKTKDGVKRFRVSVPETAWGQSGFTYTDKVEYQHKVYEFKISKKEIGAGTNDSIQLAFSAYGTAAPTESLFPAIAYNSKSREYLVVSEEKFVGNNIYGRFADENADWITDRDPFLLNDKPLAEIGWGYSPRPKLSYDSINNRFLVVWVILPEDNNPMILGQLLNGDGTKIGENFVISNTVGWGSTLSIAYNSKDKEYLVVWNDCLYDSDDIFGRCIDSDGKLIGNKVIDICTSSGIQASPCVEYSPADNAFLVVWEDVSSIEEDRDIWGCLVKGAEVVVNSETIFNSYISGNPGVVQKSPSITYNNNNKKLLVAWADSRNNYKTPDAIYGRYVNFDEETEELVMDDEMLIFQEDETAIENVSTTYNRGNILSTWIANHQAYGTLSDDEFSSPDPLRIEICDEYNTYNANPSSAANTNLGNYVVAYSCGINYSDENPQVLLKLIGEAASPSPGKLQFKEAEYHVDEDCDTLEVVVERAGGVDGEVTVKYKVSGGTATAHDDYDILGDTLTFSDGDTEKYIHVKIVDDNVIEGPEFLDIELCDIRGADYGEMKSTRIYINDNDMANVKFEKAAYEANEKDGLVPVKVIFSGLPEQQLEVFSAVYEAETVFSVVYESIDAGAGKGTATPIYDYTPVSGTLDFGWGGSTKTFYVPIINDDDPEDSETINLKLSFDPICKPYLDNKTGKYAIHVNDYTVILGTPDKTVLTIKDNDTRPSNPGSGNTGSSSSKGSSSTYIAPVAAEIPPPIKDLPNDALVGRMPGYVAISEPTKIDEVKNEISLSYNKSTLSSNPGHDARIYYWRPDVKKWVALATYPDGDGRVKAVNDGGYKGWFVVFGVVQPHFSDVSNSWAEQLINRMNGLGLIEGYSVKDSGLRLAKPEQKVTRAEFTMFVTRIMNMNPDNILLPNIPESEVESILSQGYTDSAEISPWVRAAAAKATKAGIVPFEGSSFKPLEPITRIEAAVMVSRALKKFKDFKPIDLSSFKDSRDIPGWAVGEVVENAVEGYPDNTMKPNADISRAESLAMLLRLFIKGLGW